jgi:hypothetical protein
VLLSADVTSKIGAPLPGLKRPQDSLALSWSLRPISAGRRSPAPGGRAQGQSIVEWRWRPTWNPRAQFRRSSSTRRNVRNGGNPLDTVPGGSVAPISRISGVLFAIA